MRPKAEETSKDKEGSEKASAEEEEKENDKEVESKEDEEKDQSVDSEEEEKEIVSANADPEQTNRSRGRPRKYEKSEVDPDSWSLRTRTSAVKSKVTSSLKYQENVEDGFPCPKVQLYKGKIEVEWRQINKIGAGLQNMGNTCFMNTVIQCLIYCPPLANYLSYGNDHSSKCHISRGSVDSSFCMMCILQEVMRRMIGKTGDVIKPMEVYKRLESIASHFEFGRQQDAHEFLRFVIDNLWKACLPQNKNCVKLDPGSKQTTVVNQIFGGYLRSQVTCLRCKEKSNTFDHFMDFILDIKNVRSLQKALEKYTHPELLDQENSYNCSNCKMEVTAQKQFTVHKSPNVATFQLKRFDFSRSYGGKITKRIHFPELLNLRPYMSDSKGDPVWYRLNAVLVHSGTSCDSGHYFCYVKNSNGTWYIMDDSRVLPVNLRTVLIQSAYVLFYVKAETPQAPTFKVPFSACTIAPATDETTPPSEMIVEQASVDDSHVTSEIHVPFAAFTTDQKDLSMITEHHINPTMRPPLHNAQPIPCTSNSTSPDISNNHINPTMRPPPPKIRTIANQEICIICRQKFPNRSTFINHIRMHYAQQQQAEAELGRVPQFLIRITPKAFIVEMLKITYERIRSERKTTTIVKRTMTEKVIPIEPTSADSVAGQCTFRVANHVSLNDVLKQDGSQALSDPTTETVISETVSPIRSSHRSLQAGPQVLSDPTNETVSETASPIRSSVHSSVQNSSRYPRDSSNQICSYDRDLPSNSTSTVNSASKMKRTNVSVQNTQQEAENLELEPKHKKRRVLKFSYNRDLPSNSTSTGASVSKMNDTNASLHNTQQRAENKGFEPKQKKRRVLKSLQRIRKAPNMSTAKTVSSRPLKSVHEKSPRRSPRVSSSNKFCLHSRNLPSTLTSSENTTSFPSIISEPIPFTDLIIEEDENRNKKTAIRSTRNDKNRLRRNSFVQAATPSDFRDLTSNSTSPSMTTGSKVHCTNVSKSISEEPTSCPSPISKPISSTGNHKNHQRINWFESAGTHSDYSDLTSNSTCPSMTSGNQMNDTNVSKSSFESTTLFPYTISEPITSIPPTSKDDKNRNKQAANSNDKNCQRSSSFIRPATLLDYRDITLNSTIPSMTSGNQMNDTNVPNLSSESKTSFPSTISESTPSISKEDKNSNQTSIRSTSKEDKNRNQTSICSTSKEDENRNQTSIRPTIIKLIPFFPPTSKEDKNSNQ